MYSLQRNEKAENEIFLLIVILQFSQNINYFILREYLNTQSYLIIIQILTLRCYFLWSGILHINNHGQFILRMNRI